jgi:hypothetical protein
MSNYQSHKADIDKQSISYLKGENDCLTARIAELEGALHDNKMRAGAGLDIPSERVDALNDIYETARDVLGE